jgi:hypothetical protein
MGLFLAGLYSMTAKAAILLAVLGHFWLLRGLASLLRGDRTGSFPEFDLENAHYGLFQGIGEVDFA